MGENAIITKKVDPNIEIDNGNDLEKNLSLKKDNNSPKDILIKEKSQLKKPLKITDTT